MHVPQIGRRTVLQGLGDDLSQALGRKGVIRQTGQRQPFETDLPAIALPTLPDRGKIFALTMEDRFDLMEVPMDPVHGMVLADVLAEVEEALRHDVQSEFLEDFAAHGVTQRLSMILTAARQDEELPFFGADTHGEDIAAAQDDGAGRRPDPGGSTTGLTARSGHATTLPGPARQ